MYLTMMWPPEMVITESMFRHFSGLTEVSGYLKNNSEVVRKSGLSVRVCDCAVINVTALNIVKVARESRIVSVYVNMNNIDEAYRLIKFLKSVNKALSVVVYGEAVSCNPDLFSKIMEVDYVICNGEIEYGIECVVIQEIGAYLEQYCDLSETQSYVFGKKIKVDCVLPESKWGVTDFSISPIDQYLDLSHGELHMLINKGCPFYCKFCNERIVSSNKVRYRRVEQVVGFLSAEYSGNVKSVYLDASTFTYDKDWVIELCDELAKCDHSLPWKTCTRLDCLDEDLIRMMSEAGCERISIGVESFDTEIQKGNRKVVGKDRLIWFSELCHKYGIKPRALLIIGLEGQKKEDIYDAVKFCADNNIDARFRVLQDYSALIECNSISEIDFCRLDRWNTWNPFEDMEINDLRAYEYPVYKMEASNYV